MREKVALHTLDIVGVATAGSAKPWNALVRDYAVEESRPGPCSVVGSADRVRADWAALANATAAHGIELDDYHVPAAVHAGCVVIPTVLALGEALGATSRQAMTAAAVGLEIVIRLGLAFSPEMTLDRGFHVTSAFGGIGAAAAAISLQGLSVDQASSAFGLAIAQAGGTTEYTRSGGEVKRLHAGFAAAAGIRSVALAGRGATGPAHAFEGPKGFAAAFAGRRADLAMLTAGLGQQWNLAGLGVKTWCTCTGNHASVAAMASLRERGLRPRDVVRITAFVDTVTAEHCGHIGARARDMTGAQFSTHVSLAMQLVLGGNDLRHYEALEQRQFDIPDVNEIAEKVHVRVGAEQDAAFGSGPSARIVVELVDGSTVAAAGVAPGSPGNPVGWAAVATKAHACADDLLGPHEVDRIITTLGSWVGADRPVVELFGERRTSPASPAPAVPPSLAR